MLRPFVLEQLRRGELETPKSGGPEWQYRRVHMLATPMQSLQAAAEVARHMGLTAHVLSDEIEGESSEVGRVHAALARAAARGTGPFKSPCVLLSGGETTVTVRPLPDGWKRGIRIGNLADGKVLYRIPDPLEMKGTSAAEGVAVDAHGTVYGGEVGPRQLARHVRNELAERQP